MGRIQTWHSRLPPGLSQRWLPLLAAMPLLCLLALEAVAIVDTLRYRPTTSANSTQTALKPGELAGRIGEARWFGTPSNGAPASALPETSLALTLRAVFVGERQSSAIIESADGIAQVVRTGGTITPGITLAEVRPDRIVVTRNGQHEQLFFPAEAATRDVAGFSTTADTATPALPNGQQTDEQKRANIMRRLEALRARGAG